MLPPGENGEPFNPESKKEERKKKKKKDFLKSLGESSCGCNHIGSTVTARRHDRLVGGSTIACAVCLVGRLDGCLIDCAIPTSCLRLSET